MTKPEFLQGWGLLVVQPWGRCYGKVDHAGALVGEGAMQRDLYFDAVRWAQAQAWVKVAKQFASGEKWPSIDALVTALRVVNQHYVPALQDRRTPEYCECPDEVRQVLDRLQCRQTFSFPGVAKGAA